MGIRLENLRRDRHVFKNHGQIHGLGSLWPNLGAQTPAVRLFCVVFRATASQTGYMQLSLSEIGGLVNLGSVCGPFKLFSGVSWAPLEHLGHF